MRRQKLALLTGLRWAGHLTVLGRLGGGFLVEFDAFDSDTPTEHWIGDRAVLTPKQLRDWTGSDG